MSFTVGRSRAVFVSRRIVVLLRSRSVNPRLRRVRSRSQNYVSKVRVSKEVARLKVVAVAALLVAALGVVPRR